MTNQKQGRPLKITKALLNEEPSEHEKQKKGKKTPIVFYF